MKKLIFIALCLIGMTANAQTNVYFSNLTSKTAVGLGVSRDNPNRVTVSLMQINRRKAYSGFGIVTADGSQPLIANGAAIDTVYCIETCKMYNHECDFTMDKRQFDKVCSELEQQRFVYINKTKYSGEVLAKVLKGLESEIVSARRTGIPDWNGMMAFKAKPGTMLYMRPGKRGEQPDRRFVRMQDPMKFGKNADPLQTNQGVPDIR